MTASKRARIFGIPMDLGQNRRGVDMGPSALRYANLQQKLEQLGYDVHDEGNVPVTEVEQIDDETTANARFLPQVTSVCQHTYDAISTCLQPGEFGIFLGGDHSISIGTVSAVVGAMPGEVGVVWVDAHADMNTPQTSPSGNIHGMSVAVLLGDGAESLVTMGGAGAKLKPEHIAMVGIRDLDPEEREYVRQTGVTIYSMRDVDERGIAEIARRILNQFAHLQRLHISFDLDSCDPTLTPGVGTPVRGGLRYREAHLLMEIFADSGKVHTMDVVEVNPILDVGNSTAEIAVEMVLSLAGKRIL